MFAKGLPVTVRQVDSAKSTLRAMEPEDHALLADHLALVELPVGFKIAEKKKTLENVYFPESGIGVSDGHVV